MPKSTLTVAVGDDVRVHFHPPLPVRSFVEGPVSRIDESVPQGPLIVVDVIHQVILGRELPLRRGHQEYILSARWQDFHDQIEVLHRAAPERDGPPAFRADQDVTTDRSPIPISKQPDISEMIHQEDQPQEVRRRSGVIAALFGRTR